MKQCPPPALLLCPFIKSGGYKAGLGQPQCLLGLLGHFHPWLPLVQGPGTGQGFWKVRGDLGRVQSRVRIQPFSSSKAGLTRPPVLGIQKRMSSRSHPQFPGLRQLVTDNLVSSSDAFGFSFGHGRDMAGGWMPSALHLLLRCYLANSFQV